MDKNILENLAGEGLSSYKIAKQLRLSQTTVLYWMAKYGLKTNRKHHCRLCGTTDRTHFSVGRFTDCKKCRVRFQKKLYKKYKLELVGYKGGKCETCGYSKCLGALDFHHKNPNEKDPKWNLMRCWTPSKVKTEVDKCQLLCKNCHAELHNEE